VDATQASEHLDLVNTSLRRAQSAGHIPAIQFIVWGIVGITFNVVGQLVNDGLLRPGAFWVAGCVLAAAIVISVWDILQHQKKTGRQSTIGSLAGPNFWAASAVMTVASVVLTMTKLFPPFAPPFFYAAGMASALLALGFGLRVTSMALGGLALLAAIVVAALVPAQLGWILAIGNFGAFIVPGVFALRKTDG
jgi:hypothetical protein